jgi:hypothetical protein
VKKGSSPQKSSQQNDQNSLKEGRQSQRRKQKQMQDEDLNNIYL